MFSYGNFLKKRVIKQQATPKWSNKEIIDRVYKKSIELTKETGICYVVDHIFPLRGKLVSGLHIETNLQIITYKQNSKKFGLENET